MKVKTINISKPFLSYMDQLITQELYNSRSDVLRTALHWFLQKQKLFQFFETIPPTLKQHTIITANLLVNDLKELKQYIGEGKQWFSASELFRVALREFLIKVRQTTDPIADPIIINSPQFVPQPLAISKEIRMIVEVLQRPKLPVSFPRFKDEPCPQREADYLKHYTPLEEKVIVEFNHGNLNIHNICQKISHVTAGIVRHAYCKWYQKEQIYKTTHAQLIYNE
jgi:hypothetical protein